MAITETTAEAPCPIFAGRGISTRGFTLALPKKGYLSCTPDNIDSENYILGVYNYDLATRVKDDTDDAIAFGVWVETGSDTDAVTTAKHMHAVDFSMKVTEDYVFDAGSERNADIRCARVRIEALDSVDGVIHAMYLNARVNSGETPTFKGRYLEYTSSYGVIGLEIRTEVIGETGTATFGDGTSYGICGLLVTHKSDAGITAITGAYQGIAMHCPYEGTTFSGTTTGMLFINTVILAGTAWDIGIDFGDSMVTTAIDIGTCTTGIAITGVTTDGIKISSASTDGIEISGACTAYGINISGTQAETGIYVKARKKGINIYTIMDETISANQWSIHVETNLGGSAVCTGTLESMRIEMYTNSSATWTGDCITIHIANYLEKAPSGSYYFMRLAENYTGRVVTAAMWVSGSISNLFNLAGTPVGWDSGSDVATSGTKHGKIGIMVNGQQRWLQLYEV